MVIQCPINLVHWPYEHVKPVGVSDGWYTGIRLTPAEQHPDHWLCSLSDEPSLMLPGAAVRIPKYAIDRLPHEHDTWLVVEPIKKVRRSINIRYDRHINNNFWSAFASGQGVEAHMYLTKPDTDSRMIRVYNYKAKDTKVLGKFTTTTDRYALYQPLDSRPAESVCIAGLYMVFGEIPKTLWWKPVKQ